jgi:hypothetical protein
MRRTHSANRNPTCAEVLTYTRIQMWCRAVDAALSSYRQGAFIGEHTGVVPKARRRGFGHGDRENVLGAVAAMRDSLAPKVECWPVVVARHAVIAEGAEDPACLQNGATTAADDAAAAPAQVILLRVTRTLATVVAAQHNADRVHSGSGESDPHAALGGSCTAVLDLLAEVSQRRDALSAFVRWVREHVCFNFVAGEPAGGGAGGRPSGGAGAAASENVAATQLLKPGSQSWLGRVKESLRRIRVRVFDPSERLAAWQQCFAGAPGIAPPPPETARAATAVSQLSQMIALTAVDEFMASALGVAMSPTSTRTAVEDGGDDLDARVAALATRDAVATLSTHGRLEAMVLSYVVGWVLRSLDKKRSFTHDESGTLASRVIVSTDSSIGAAISDKLEVGVGVRLWRPVPAVMEFTWRLELFIRACVFNPATLLAHGALVYVRGMELLSRSVWLRQQWQTTLSSLGWTVAADGAADAAQMSSSDRKTTKVIPLALSVELLERFVRTYMKSRLKTFRDVAGVMPGEPFVVALPRDAAPTVFCCVVHDCCWHRDAVLVHVQTTVLEWPFATS